MTTAPLFPTAEDPGTHPTVGARFIAPTGWSRTTVGALAASSANALVGGPFGSNLVSADYVADGIPVIRGQNMGQGRWVGGEFAFVDDQKADELRANVARPGDIVFTQRGTLGQVAVVPPESFERYIVSQSQMKLTVDPTKADPLFVYYYFSTDEQQEYIKANAIQTGVPHTNLGVLRSTPITLPPLHEQRAIAAVLGALDDKIELNRKTSQTLEQVARALFNSWFVRFDPVHAKVAGRTPDGMDSATAALFTDSLEDSDYGMVPQGWMPTPVRDLVKINSWTLSSRDPIDRIEYIEISEVELGRVKNVQSYERGSEPGRARRRLRHGDTVISTVRPDRGAHFLVLDPLPALIASTGFAVLTPHDSAWSFVYAAMTDPEVGVHLGRVADGGAYPAVSSEVIGEWIVVCPNDGRIVERFHEMCGPLFELSASLDQEARDMSQTRDTLLPMLLSGELTVPVRFLQESI